MPNFASNCLVLKIVLVYDQQMYEMIEQGPTGGRHTRCSESRRRNYLDGWQRLNESCAQICRNGKCAHFRQHPHKVTRLTQAEPRVCGGAHIYIYIHIVALCRNQGPGAWQMLACCELLSSVLVISECTPTPLAVARHTLPLHKQRGTGRPANVV